MTTKEVIRKGSPFAPSDVESLILRGMRGSYSLRRYETKFYAGDAAHCPRRAVKFLTTERQGETTPASIMYMKVGVTIHDVVTDALHASKSLVFKELRLPPSEDPDLRGLIDAVLIVNNSIVGLEIKSCGNLPPKPKEDHLAQATTYAAISGFDMQILYVSRKVAGYDGKLMLKSFDLDLMPSEMIQVLEKICLAHYAYADGFLPPIPMGFSRDKNCGFCPFADECWEGAPEELPTATSETLEGLIDRAGVRAIQIFEDRSRRRNGILKHIMRNTTDEIREKLESLDWS